MKLLLVCLILIFVITAIVSGLILRKQKTVSKFFNNDSTAQRILHNEETYNTSRFTVCPASDAEVIDSSNYGFKLLNALKQLGYYFPPTECYTFKVLINRFQSDNGLSVSDILDKETLLEIDKQLAQVEKEDVIGKEFVCFAYLQEAPKNDASQEHRAAILHTAINVFPDKLRLQKSDCSNPQVQLGITDTNNSVKYWPAYDENNQLREDFSIETLPLDDFTIFKTMVHEYAHFIDCNITGVDYCINTDDFYNISFNIDNYKDDNGWRMYTLRFNLDDPKEAQLNFFSYAEGFYLEYAPQYRTAYEDFAVSVEMYVTNGIVFRDYMEDKPILKRKYDFIKEHVFLGKEFNTGDPNYASYAPNLFDLSKFGIVAAGGIRGVGTEYRWSRKEYSDL